MLKIKTPEAKIINKMSVLLVFLRSSLSISVYKYRHDKRATH